MRGGIVQRQYTDRYQRRDEHDSVVREEWGLEDKASKSGRNPAYQWDNAPVMPENRDNDPNSRSRTERHIRSQELD